MILKNVRIMPDCHKGNGCCVGLTAKIDNKIFPRYVGFDIGCGISIYPLNIKLKRKKIPKIELLIRKCIPMGNDKNGIHMTNQLREIDWEWLEKVCTNDLNNLKLKKQKEYPDYKFPDKIDKDWIISMINRIGGNLKKDLKSMGTLGGGNHYVEINEDVDSVEPINYITVHSGSRNLGLKICKYHQSKIDNNCKFDWIEYNSKMKKIKKKYRSSKKVHEYEIKIKEEMKSSLHPLYLEGIEMLDYLVDMIVGQNIASLNRIIMIRNVVDNLVNESFDMSKIIETRHNYIDFDRFMLRKGSISAEDGQICIISLNMRDGILLCKGKGNPDWNYSSAHGCGRIMNRSYANRHLSMKKFIKEMKGVYSTSIRKETLDEAPMAYRDVGLVKKCLEGSVSILKQLVPVINCKGF